MTVARGQAPTRIRIRIRITFMSVYIILNANGSIEKRFGSKRFAIYANIHSRAHNSDVPVNWKLESRINGNFIQVNPTMQ